MILDIPKTTVCAWSVLASFLIDCGDMYTYSVIMDRMMKRAMCSNDSGNTGMANYSIAIQHMKQKLLFNIQVLHMYEYRGIKPPSQCWSCQV